MGGPKIDLSGQEFGRLKVIHYAGKDKQGHSLWLCSCNCGNSTVVAGYNLKSHKIISCGCARREHCGSMNLTHGHSNTRLYSIFSNMISRTENPRKPDFQFYGGRGITVCPEWRYDFPTFENWALRHGYAPGLTIDRIDNNRGYFPDNCRWVDRKKQAENRRGTVVLTFNGKSENVKNWARLLGVPASTLYGRIQRGWSTEEVLKEAKL